MSLAETRAGSGAQIKTRERVVRFGPNEELVGVLHDCKPQAIAETCVLINAGVVSRVGPFRLYVELARALAAQGVRTLRFDLSGLGDSEAYGAGLSTEERGLRDVRAAIDFVDTKWPGGVVLAGLCSGACHAHNVAVVDERVTGACFIDGYAYRTPTYRRRRWLRLLTKPRFWLEAPRRIAVRNALREDPNDAGAQWLEEEGFCSQPEAAVVDDQIRALAERGARLLFVYTDGSTEVSSTRQFAEMFPRAATYPNVSVRYLEGAAHTFPFGRARSRLTRLLTSFLLPHLERADEASSLSTMTSPIAAESAPRTATS